tara:strand:+ start:2035 stop:3162 length:1128 start_codon:yes stop_codon:yes gene_type:complete
MKIFISCLSGRVYGGASYYKNLIPEIVKSDQLNKYYIWVRKKSEIFPNDTPKNIIFYEVDWRIDYFIYRIIFEQLIIPIYFFLLKGDTIFYGKNIGSILFSNKNILAIRNVEPFFYSEFNNTPIRHIISFLRLKISLYSIKKSKKIIAVSNSVREILISRFKVNSSKVYTIYNGCNVSPDYKGAWSSKADNNSILIISKFVPYANQYNVLLAYNEFIKKIDVSFPRLIILGGIYDKKYYQKCLKFIRDANLEKYIDLRGYVNKKDVYRFSIQSNFYIHASKLEACPHTLIEMMSIGIPIICSDIEPMPEITQDASILFDPDNVNSIVAAMKKIFFNKKKANANSRHGKNISKKYNWKETGNSYLNIFLNTLKNKH